MNPTAPRLARKSRLSAFLHLLGRVCEIRASIGLVNTLKLFVGHRLSGEYQLHLSFLPAPIHLRARSTDAHVFRKVFIGEEYFVPGQHPRLIIDAGANVGISAVYFAHRYPTATILCLEPEDSNAAQFQTNTRAYPNIQLLHGALWSKTARLSITNPRADKVSFVVGEASDAHAGAIPGYSVQDLLERSGADRIDIFKIDIEGSEAQVFAGETDEWLSKVGVILIELHENKAPGCGRRFFSASARHPFRYYQQGENVVLIRDPKGEHDFAVAETVRREPSALGVSN